MKTILILATLDTKYDEALLLKKYVKDNGCRVIILDCSLRNSLHSTENIQRTDMMKRAGISEETLSDMSKNDALQAMTRMASLELKHMYESGMIDGAVGIGGVQGTLISSGAMQNLPVGVPKLVLSAVANGNTTFGPLVGTSDMMIMHSVVDVAGNNGILRQLMSNAASAVCGMVNHTISVPERGRMIGLTMGGVTTRCGNYIKEILEEQGYEVVIFHCNGIGATAMEMLAEEGKISAVIDLTPHDVTDYLFGGIMPAGRDRYEVYKRVKVPIVIVPGCADIILFNGKENVPEQYQKRKFVEHNKIHTHIKADYNEMFELGKYIAEKANDFLGEASILIPVRGYSQKNFPGGVLYEPESDRGFVEAVMKYKNRRVEAEVVPLHINDREFAGMCVKKLIEMSEGREKYAG